MRALLVVNPASTGSAPRTVDVLGSALAGETKLDVVTTNRRGHAREAAEQAVLDGLDLVVALGGDGTVNEVVNGLLHRGPSAEVPALGVVPAGSTNVFARSLGLPQSPVEATAALLEALREDRRRRIGLGVAAVVDPPGRPDRWFTFSAGLGMDAEVVRRVEAARAAGRRSTAGLYIRQAVWHFFTAAERRDPPLEVVLPDREPVPAFLGVVCNTSPWTYVGDRPVRCAPRASFDTGLDVFALRRFSTATTLRQLRRMFSAPEGPRGRSVLSAHDLPEVVLRANRSQPFQIDGDDVGDCAAVRFRSVPRALAVAV